MMTLGDYITKRRSEISLGQNELAEKAGIDPSSLSKIVAGDRQDIRMSTLIGLARALKVSPMVLINVFDKKELGETKSIPKEIVMEAAMNFLETISPDLLTEIKDSGNVQPEKFTDRELRQLIEAKYPGETERTKFVKPLFKPMTGTDKVNALLKKVVPRWFFDIWFTEGEIVIDKPRIMKERNE